MIPAYARPAHRRLRDKLGEIAAWNEVEGPNRVFQGNGKLGILTSGVTSLHVREAAPQVSVLKLGMAHPLPEKAIRAFVGTVDRCVVLEEGDPYLLEQIRAVGIPVEGKPESFRFGEMNVDRVRRILEQDASPEPQPAKGKPPALCKGCPHRPVFEVLHELDCIVAGDIGCYSLGALPPFNGMDTCVCMGASIGVGLGMRHVLPEAQARRVVSVIGDSTFVHSGLTGLAEMVYNPPPTGHLVLILDNGTTAMTGQQEHPGTGRNLVHQPTGRVRFEEVARAMGIEEVHVIDPTRDRDQLRGLIEQALNRDALRVIVTRRPCLLAAGKIRKYREGGRDLQVASIC